MVTQSDTELWANVMKLILPGQLLRGILMASALYPFYEILCNWKYSKRFFTVTSIYVIFGFWASAVAAPGTIDGLIYMRPEISGYAHFMVQPEIVGQGILLGLWFAWWIRPKQHK
ncbi:MAG: hypothetical protein MUO72_05895 [Bacteroidales bacterium]|nr:hypothetical protein [Bacteroidales bacterium]